MLGRLEDKECEVVEHRLIRGEQCAVACTSLVARRVVKPLGDTCTIGFISDLLPISGKLYGALVFWTCAKSSARLRMRWVRRLSQSRVARISAG